MTSPMNRYCTYTTDLVTDPQVLPQGQDATDLPEDVVDWVWQTARSEAAAILLHDLRLDEYLAGQEGVTLVHYREHY